MSRLVKRGQSSAPKGSTLVGVGGWAYLPIRNKAEKLSVCSRLYDFVEVNSTFYSLPDVRQARSWRQEVSDPQFEFTVRANRALTHTSHLEPSKENFRLIDEMLEICDELNARVLHFQFPASLRVSEKVIREWRDFFGSLGRKSGLPKFSFEVRNSATSKFKEVKSFFDEYDIIPTSDPSRTVKAPLETSKDSRVMYSRVFGPGTHTAWSFDTEELKRIDKNVQQTPAKKRYVTFHNVTMYEDASRMKGILEGEGEVGGGRRKRERVDLANKLGVAASVVEAPMGSDSLRKALSLARIEYPVTREVLKAKAGWRTFDLEPGRKVHLWKYLECLPDSRKEFRSEREVVDLLSKLF